MALRIIVFDTETTGFPRPSLPLEDQPYVTEFAGICLEWDAEAGTLTEIKREDQLIRPLISIPRECVQLNGIDDAMVAHSPTFADRAAHLHQLFGWAHVAVAHNLDFDQKILENEFERAGLPRQFLPGMTFDTMKSTVDFCAIPNGKGSFKYPTLTELHKKLFGVPFGGAHRAMADVEATCYILQALLAVGVWQPQEPTVHSLF